MKNGVSGIEVRVADIEQAGNIASAIQKELGFPYLVRDWMRMNKNLFFCAQTRKDCYVYYSDLNYFCGGV
jgi:hypothetical protein